MEIPTEEFVVPPIRQAECNGDDQAVCPHFTNLLRGLARRSRWQALPAAVPLHRDGSRRSEHMERPVGSEVFQEERGRKLVATGGRDVIDISSEVLQRHILSQPPPLLDRLDNLLLPAGHEAIDAAEGGHSYGEAHGERHRRPPPARAFRRRHLHREIGRRWFECRHRRGRECAGRDDQAIDRRHAATGDDSPAFHPQLSVGDRRDCRVVCHHDDGRRASRLDLRQNADDLLFRKEIEVVGRLVGKDHAGLRRQRADQRHPPLLAARELSRIGVPTLRKADLGQHLLRLGGCRVAIPAGDQLRQHHVVDHPQPGQQNALLEQKADLLRTGCLDFVGPKAGPWASSKGDAAARRRAQPAQQGEQRRFS